MPETLLQPEERVLSTLEKDGSRRWLTPRLAKGRFLTRRRAVAYGLIALFTLIPYIAINGKPAMLLDVVHRQFTLFGFTFLPTDTVLLALFMVTLILSIFITTALLGRIWCGWACPQTVYMEFVFRPIERLCLGRSGVGGKPATAVAGWRYVAMYAAFFAVCLYLAHTFLAYFVGVESLRKWVTGSPVDHPAAFAIIVVVTLLMLFDFVFFREQTCIIACPYGRFQSVMLDRASLIIAYDERRGEPRGKLATAGRSRAVKAAGSSVLPADPPVASGDCIDCTLCVQVCPTGIDIRQGLQLECIGCAQCIDACDAVMDKIKRPRGLIRYSSQQAMAGEVSKLVRPRVVIYAAIIVGLVSLLTYLLVTKSPTDVTVLRALGRPYLVLEDGRVENNLRLKITNRSATPQQYRVETTRPEIDVAASVEVIPLRPGEMRTEPIRLHAPRDLFAAARGAIDVELKIVSNSAPPIYRKARLLGPSHGATTRPANVGENHVSP